MRWFRLVPMCIVIVVLTLMGGVGGVGGAHAAPSGASTTSTTYSAPREGAKVILGEFSIDGPAILATYQPQTVLAWTGTDAAHHLNLLTSADGLHYSAKVILPETSLWRPALAFIDSGRGAPYGTIVLAWTGTDSAHTLNMEFISLPGLTVREKITFWGETSFTAPALATVNGDINSDVYLAWAGTDAAHTLNVIHHTTSVESNSKQTLWGWNSVSRPNLSPDQNATSGTALILAWTGVNHHLYFAQSADRTHWTMPSSSPLSQQSAWAPSLIAFYATNMPAYWLAWTGSGSTSTQQLSVAYTQQYPTWSAAGTSTMLTETAISSPALAYNGVNRQVLLAWTGTNAAHSLNVAVVDVTA